jgi:hypothetical protein
MNKNVLLQQLANRKKIRKVSNQHKMLGKAFSKNTSLLLNQFGSEG